MTTQECHDCKSLYIATPGQLPFLMESRVPRYLRNCFFFSQNPIHLVFLAGSMHTAPRCGQHRYRWLRKLALLLWEVYAEHAEPRWAAWSLFFGRERLWGCFWTVVNKRRELYKDMHLPTERHWVLSTLAYTQRHTVSALTLTHTPHPSHTDVDYECCECREFTGVCLLPNDDEIPDL